MERSHASHTWRDPAQWDIALPTLVEMLRQHLDPPTNSSTLSLPIEAIRYTQKGCSVVFRHGVHANRTVQHVADDLVAGRLRPTDPDMALDVVFYHGHHWSLNNRHLLADKIYLKEVQPEWKRAEEMASAKCWPLSPALRLHGSPLIDKFADLYDTNTQGRSVSVRSSSRSLSQPRRVHFERSAKTRDVICGQGASVWHLIGAI